MWSDNSSSSSLEINTTGFYRVTTTNINGCVAKDTIHVSISGLAPNAQFASQNVCLGSNSFFADQSTSTSPDVIELWQWDFGDGNVSSDQNPTYVYSNIGVYDVQLYIETNVGCGAFANASVEVFENPVAGFTVAGFCSLDNIKFTDASSNGGATIDNWSWDFGQPSSGSGNSSDLASPTKTFNEKGIFTVRLTVEDENSCTSFIQKNLDVKASPQTSFSFSDTCAGLTVKLLNETTIQSPAVVTNYLWTFGDGNISLQSNPSKSYSTFGKYEAILKATSNEGCIFSDTNEIEVFPIPVASMEIGPVCKSAITEFIDNSTIAEGSIASSKWYINLNDSIMGTPASYVFNDFGQQQVVLKTTASLSSSIFYLSFF